MRRQPRRRLHWLYLDVLLAPSGRPSCPLPPAPVVLPNAPLLPETSRTRTQTSSNEIIFSPPVFALRAATPAGKLFSLVIWKCCSLMNIMESHWAAGHHLICASAHKRCL